MHILFTDIAAAYDVESPARQSLGGTQAAVCHLAPLLGHAGARVTLVNQSRASGEKKGVMHLPPEKLEEDTTLADVDVIIINGRWTKNLISGLRKRSKAKLVGWMHEASFNDPWILPLPDFAAFVFVSDWQRRINAPLLPATSRSFVIPNGIAPGFHTLFSPGEHILPAKAAPICAYVGGSKRGLLHLPDILPLLYDKRPDLTYEIYSDCVISTHDAENRALCERLAALPGVTHIGDVPQTELAQRLKRVRYLLSPNPYPETFCISLAEAMAAGCFCIATRRAALGETAGGFGALMPFPQPDDVNNAPERLDTEAFADFALNALQEWEGRDTAEKETALLAQIALTHAHYDWQRHAEQWMGILRGV
jgi:glycosyltransferase involved in cell wall biosynthesis